MDANTNYFLNTCSFRIASQQYLFLCVCVCACVSNRVSLPPLTTTSAIFPVQNGWEAKLPPVDVKTRLLINLESFNHQKGLVDRTILRTSGKSRIVETLPDVTQQERSPDLLPAPYLLRVSADKSNLLSLVLSCLRTNDLTTWQIRTYAPSSDKWGLNLASWLFILKKLQITPWS